jgi:hypothetical protein
MDLLCGDTGSCLTTVYTKSSTQGNSAQVLRTARPGRIAAALAPLAVAGAAGAGAKTWACAGLRIGHRFVCFACPPIRSTQRSHAWDCGACCRDLLLATRKRAYSTHRQSAQNCDHLAAVRKPNIFLLSEFPCGCQPHQRQNTRFEHVTKRFCQVLPILPVFS